MRPLVAAELLDVWERERTSLPWQKALSLLAISCPEYTPENLAHFVIGQRDGLLFQLREWTFGSELSSMARCPACNEQVEFVFTAEDVLTDNTVKNDTAEGNGESGVVEFQTADYRGTVRLPNTRDMAAVMDITDQQAAYRALIATCLVEVSSVSHEPTEDDDLSTIAQSLPPDVQEAIVQRLQEADPQADIQFALTCPTCDHQWSAPFDIISFFWSEIDDWAGRTLREVHSLASVYGWSEHDILAMSAGRRRVYLEMVYG